MDDVIEDNISYTFNPSGEFGTILCFRSPFEATFDPVARHTRRITPVYAIGSSATYRGMDVLEAEDARTLRSSVGQGWSSELFRRWVSRHPLHCAGYTSLHRRFPRIFVSTAMKHCAKLCSMEWVRDISLEAPSCYANVVYAWNLLDECRVWLEEQGMVLEALAVSGMNLEYWGCVDRATACMFNLCSVIHAGADPDMLAHRQVDKGLKRMGAAIADILWAWDHAGKKKGGKKPPDAKV